MVDGTTFDYVIVGGGTAGCVLANRLTEDGRYRVLMLEAGSKDTNPWIHIPIGYGKTMFNQNVNWGFYTEAQASLNDRKIYWPRGRTLGGSSSINGLVFIRGQLSDYDNWAALGNRGWSSKDVLHYFRKSEANSRGESTYHGGAGPLRVSDMGDRHELMDAFIAAGAEIGVPRNDDFNGSIQEGVGYFQLHTHRGLRWSAAKGYLKPALHRANLRVETGAHTTRIAIQKDRATGVHIRQGGRDMFVGATKEVIISAGSVQSPQLLQLSGVGAPALLASHGIPLVASLPGVGENLQDHLQVRLIYECTKPITTNDDLRTLWGRIRIGLQWLLFRNGPMGVGIQLGGMFARALPSSKTPDIQFHFGSISADVAAGKPHKFSGFTVSMCQLRPSSRGYVRIRSADPFAPPSIQPHYLSTTDDETTMLEGVRFARRLVSTKALGPYIADEFRPGFDKESATDLLGFIREYGTTIFHPVGTCKMGDDSAAVVDERLRVRGVSGLRVADASIMPTLISGNTNAASVMIGEKAADMIREDAERPISAPRSVEEREAVTA